MLFSLLVSLLGSLFVIRMFSAAVERNHFAMDGLTKIGTLYFASVGMLLILLPRSHFWTWTSVFLPALIIRISLQWLVRRREREFRESIGEVLSLVALKMKIGRSFRQAFSEVASENSSALRVKLGEIFSSVVFSQQGGQRTGAVFISDLIDELKRIDQQPHSAARRLAVLREKLRTESEFRRKSGQVVSRIRAQSAIMTALYLAIASFIGWKFGFRANAKLFALSSFLFFAGALWIWRGGRRLKWKV
jgi:hypothetical protein